MYYLINRTLPKLIDNYYCKDYLENYDYYKNKFTKPSVNIIEKEDQFLIEIAAPGIIKDDFKINLDKNVLTIATEKAKVNDEDSTKLIKKEFDYVGFERAFSLPESANSEAIKAKHENGILYITIPKKEQAIEQPPKSIKIS